MQIMKEGIDISIPMSGNDDKYPEEALPVGTYVRPIRHDRLGVITDAFYGELDANNTKIIVYTILMFPKNSPMGHLSKEPEQYYISNEYEYDIIAYLMVAPADMDKITRNLSGGLFI